MNELIKVETSKSVVGFDTEDGFELLQRQAKLFSSSQMVPKIYQNNVADCAIALDIAYRMKANPLMVMQNLDIVQGKPGWSAKFLIATINICGKFSSMEFEREGNNPKDEKYRVRAFARNLSTDQILYGEWIDWPMVTSEGWLNKNGSKWKTMPGQMFIYRAASFWQRAYCPEIGMGFMTTEELQDFNQIAEVVSETKSTRSKLANLRPKAKEQEIIETPTIEHQPAEPVEFNIETGEIPEEVIQETKQKQYQQASMLSQHDLEKSKDDVRAYKEATKGK